MITVECTVDVDRPVSAVFAYLSDFVNTEQWDPGTVTTTRSDDGPLRVGATFHNTSEFRGRRTELDYHIVRLDPDTRLTFTGVNKTVETIDDLAFRGTDAQTTIAYHAHFSFKGLARLAEPLLRRGFERIADDTAAQLKRTLESVL